MDFNKNREMMRRLLLTQRQSEILRRGEGGGEKSLATVEHAPQAKGHVKIEAVYEDGHVEVLHEDKNLVVDQAATIMPYMSLGLKQFGYIELGDPSPATPPDAADTTLEQTTGERKAISGSVSGKTVTMEAQWGTTEGNGYSFTEAGLFCNPLGSGQMFARKVFDAITKTSSFALKVTWAVTFSVSDRLSGCTGVALLGSSTLTEDYTYTAVGGETQVIVPIDFVVGSKSLDVFQNTARLYYGTHYNETTIGASKGVTFIGYTLNPGDKMYFVNRKLA